MPKGLASPFLSFVRLLYLHLVLFLALFGASDASDTTASKNSGGCPLSRLQVAFQTPFNSLSLALHGSAVGGLSSTRPGGAGPSSTSSFSSGSAAPRWVTQGASASRSARVVRSRRVEVVPLGMSAVETKQGNKRAAEDEPDSTESKAEKKARRMTASSTPLGVHVIGLSHHNAGVEVREKLAVPEAAWNDASAKVRAVTPISDRRVPLGTKTPCLGALLSSYTAVLQMPRSRFMCFCYELFIRT